MSDSDAVERAPADEGVPETPANDGIPENHGVQENDGVQENQGVRENDVAAEVEDRTYPSTLGGALYIVMLAVVTVGLLVTVLGSWRVGIRIFAAALFVGAGLRLALTERDAGMLAVRSKPIDAGTFLVVATSLAILSSVIPDQPV